MAAKTKKKEVVEISATLQSAFNDLKKMNVDSAPLSENALSIVSDYIDTGSYSLNAIISGSVYKGIPKGRITGISGPSGAGKSLIINQIIANAQKKDPDLWAVVWDSENAFDAQMAKNLGVNVDRVRHCPIECVEDCRNQMSKFLDNIAADKSLYGKVLIALDSLGNLASTKELADAAANKSSSDMGSRSKACLDPETLVLMADNTYKKIKDIKCGDKVITHLKRESTVCDIWPTRHTKIVHIKTKNSTIKLSCNHKLLVKRNNVLKYIEAQNIQKTDKLVRIV
jgi:energy-coupling factor transporter ATP-binding protein EcfA2